MRLGRDIGKLKREGFVRGTQFYRWRLIFSLAGVAYAITFGVLAYKYIDIEGNRWIRLLNENLDRITDRRGHEAKVEAIKLKRQKMEEYQRRQQSSEPDM